MVWEPLVEATNAGRIHDTTIAGGYYELVRKYGEYNGTNWPSKGCGTPFAPCEEVVSQVAVVHLDYGTWLHVATYKLPHGAL